MALTRIGRMGMRSMRLRTWPARRPREVKRSCTAPPECNLHQRGSALDHNDRDPKSSWMHGYILRCADGTFYAGSTKYLDDRVAAHQQGLGSAYTTSRRPVELISWLDFDRIDEPSLWGSRSKDGVMPGA